MDRREFLRRAILSGVVLSPMGYLLSSCGGGGGSGADSGVMPGMPNNPDTPPPATGSGKNPLLVPSEDGLLGFFSPDAPFTFTTKTIEHQIPGVGGSTTLMVYEVNQNGKTYINPILRVRKGSRFQTTLRNELNEETVIHWHGFRVDFNNDGHPFFAVGKGEELNYDFTVIDRSGSYWYHPHPHGRTGYQAYFGLASMFIIEDEDEDNLRNALDLSLGVTDIPLILQDKTFNSDGSLFYQQRLMGFYGNTPVVNLTPNPYLEVSPRIYRFRLLNGANARLFRLSIRNGSSVVPFYLIGVEGGLLSSPIQVNEILLSPGERADILVDFRNFTDGSILRLYNSSHGLGNMGMGMGGMGADSDDSEFEVLEFRVKGSSSYDRSIPSTLSVVNSIPTSGVFTRIFPLGIAQMRFNIDGKVWDSSNPLRDYGYNFNNNTVEVWEFVNNTGMYHPMHIHGYQFQVIERSNSPQGIRNLAIDNKGLMATDYGWKDTVLVAPSERVKVAVDFTHSFNYEQVYLLHCHILEHHDLGMMVNFRVKA